MKLSNKILSCLCVLASLSIFLLAKQHTFNSGSSKFKVAFITNNPSDFWTIARKGCEKADEELPDVAVEFKIPPTARPPNNGASSMTCWQKAYRASPSVPLIPPIRRI